VLAEQTTAVDPQRLGARIGRLSLHEMTELDAALRTVVGLR
jgi:mRNA interferase MazF